jgi:hypothetical protein
VLIAHLLRPRERSTQLRIIFNYWVRFCNEIFIEADLDPAFKSISIGMEQQIFTAAIENRGRHKKGIKILNAIEASLQQKIQVSISKMFCFLN